MSSRFFSRVINGFNKAICLGSFNGALEMTLAHFGKNVLAVDYECYLPNWAPKNVDFLKTNLDSAEWNIPEYQYDLCFMVEILEHFLWSPVPLLKRINQCSKILIITTPDDNEWPPMPPKGWKRFQHYSTIPAAFPGCPSNPEPMNHAKQYNVSEFIDLLSFCGFRLLEFSRVGVGSHQMMAICQSE